ncbi:MAG: tetratricopeptide repeat protein [Candidatus Edwardsbacteria bacterium]|nr:tetratricopeptide repeat protein [Candidatus Edwardsbacteria bacterium]
MSGRDAERRSTVGNRRCPRLWTEVDGAFRPFGLRARQAEVLHRVGDWARLEAICRGDLDLARGDAERGFLLLKLGTLSAQRGDAESGGRMIDAALERYREAGHAEGIEQCRRAQLNILVSRGAFAEAMAAATRLLDEAAARGDEATVCEFLNVLGIACLEQHLHDDALGYFRRKLAIAERLGLPGDQLTALGNIGCVLHDQGRYREALEHIARSIAICRRTGDRFNEYYAVYNLGKAYEGLGQAADALRCYRDDLAMARQLGDGPGEATILEDLARVNDAEASGPESTPRP